MIRLLNWELSDRGLPCLTVSLNGILSTIPHQYLSFVFVHVADLLNYEMCFSHPKNALVLFAPCHGQLYFFVSRCYASIQISLEILLDFSNFVYTPFLSCSGFDHVPPLLRRGFNFAVI